MLCSATPVQAHKQSQASKGNSFNDMEFLEYSVIQFTLVGGASLDPYEFAKIVDQTLSQLQ